MGNYWTETPEEMKARRLKDKPKKQRRVKLAMSDDERYGPIISEKTAEEVPSGQMKRKKKKYKSGGKVRGAGCARRGVRKAKMR